MEGLKSAILSICAVSMLVCVIEWLVSGTRLKNQVKFLLRVILIVTVFAAFVGGLSGLDFPELPDMDESDISYAESAYKQEFIRQTEANIDSVLAQQLEAAGVGFSKIETNVNISETNSISISSVTVSADDFEKAAEIIRSSLGEETEVQNGDF